MDNRQNARLRVPTMPEGTEVASYRTYLEASNAVDYLSDNGFDVKSITIVGSDLHMVERVTGRLTMGKVAASGAGSGALWGTFMGLMMSFATTSGQAGMPWVFIGMAGGAIFGVLMSAILYAMTGGRRDFTSQSQVVASRYAVLASADVDGAFKLLQKTPGNQMRPTPPRRRPVQTGPSEYGSRPGEKPRFGVRLSEAEKEHEEETGEAPGTDLRDQEQGAGAGVTGQPGGSGQNGGPGASAEASSPRSDAPITGAAAPAPSTGGTSGPAAGGPQDSTGDEDGSRS
ncbi:general stress protein [Actinomyces provencensis]|uniref:general stress protein n=1 Tax=Actinomyces provencensis TaxID=1720198 RepID=UPI001E326385|nr:general stress protein [Actinomyces provencensis]